MYHAFPSAYSLWCNSNYYCEGMLDSFTNYDKLIQHLSLYLTVRCGEHFRL